MINDFLQKQKYAHSQHYEKNNISYKKNGMIHCALFCEQVILVNLNYSITKYHCPQICYTISIKCIIINQNYTLNCKNKFTQDNLLIKYLASFCIIIQ